MDMGVPNIGYLENVFFMYVQPVFEYNIAFTTLILNLLLLNQTKKKKY